MVDPHLCSIIDFLKNDNKFLLSDLEPYLYRFVLSGGCYLDSNNTTYYKNKNRNCIVIPISLKYSAMRWAHGDVHNGYQRTLDKLSNRFWWPRMRDDVKIMTNTCYPCQAVKGERDPPFKAGKIKSFSQKQPFELISIDMWAVTNYKIRE